MEAGSMLNGFVNALNKLRRGDLPLACVLEAELIHHVLERVGYKERSSLYTPVCTILTFLGQVLSRDHSCQEAVEGLVAHRVTSGQPACSADTGGYCKARRRIPEQAYRELARESGRQLEMEAPAEWHWCGRRIRVADGSTLRIADTEANRRAYPLQRGITPGASYPIIRVLVVFSLAVGTVIDAALRPYQGKGTGETGMLRDLADCFQERDVLLVDRYFAGYWDIAWFLRHRVDMVTRLPKSRRADFRRGKRLGRDDHLIHWKRTEQPDWIEEEVARHIPEELTLREVRIRVDVPGFRTQEIILVTTLLDPLEYPVVELAKLYRKRWQAELSFRSLKTHMKLEQLRCKTPSMVRKEFFMHLVGYNCVRKIAAIAARENGCRPHEISFLATMQGINEFTKRLPNATSTKLWSEALINTVASVRVGNRPDRIEPYAMKTRPKEYPYLTAPRQTYKTCAAKRS